MDEGGAGVGKWKSLKQRLSIKGMACCGGGVGDRPSSNMIERDDEEDVELNLMQGETTDLEENQACLDQIPAAAAASGMNLATALAAERHLRAQNEWELGQAQGQGEGDSENARTAVVTANVTATETRSGGGTAALTRVSLMALMEEGEGREKEMISGGDGVLCCVCMGRRKGAAFIPCGHTFCRVCSRELWLNRGSCPLCNRSILEILDIF